MSDKNYKVVKKPMRKRTPYETVMNKKNILFCRALMVGRNYVVEAVIDVQLTRRKEGEVTIYSQFIYDGKEYSPNVEEMIYFDNIRYGLFLVGVPDQLEFPKDPLNKQKLIAPVMDAETYCNRQNMSFFQNLLSATGQFANLLKMVGWQLWLQIGTIAAVLITFALLLDVWGKLNGG